MSTYTSRAEEFFGLLTKALDNGLGAATTVAASASRESMVGKDRESLVTGRKPRLTFRGSDPGTPPGVRTGRLQSSISAQRLKFGESWAYGTNVKYGRIHELGGRTAGGQPYIVMKIDGVTRAVWIKRSTAARLGRRVRFTRPSIMPKRPFLKPALLNSRGGMERAFVKAATRSLGQSVTARLGGVA